PAGSTRRRSTQTALHRMVTGLCQMLAPMLAFTADEAWEFVVGRGVESVHESVWKPLGFVVPDAEREAWGKLLEVREQCLPAIEAARQAKTLGKALEARLQVTLPAATADRLRPFARELQELLNVSQLDIHSADQALDAPLKCEVFRAEGSKCERCWHWETGVGARAEHPDLCPRCVEAVTPA
ncbi:MAG: class I tRNA ligase family protein, partial [Verrucomicrobia bacterium]|nr:class I tRNA ligase family protein [Verrucomicrobiota bacterium]